MQKNRRSKSTNKPLDSKETNFQRAKHSYNDKERNSRMYGYNDY